MRMTARVLIGGVACTVAVAVVLAGVTTGPATAPTTMPVKLSHAEMVKEFGSKPGAPVDQGFVFLDGEYIDAPYVVSRDGGQVSINGRVIGTYATWPPRIITTSDPGPPPELTKDSTFAQLEYPGPISDSWDRQKIRWLQSQYALEEAMTKMVECYKELPFVKDATVIGNRISVVTYKGETHGMLVRPVESYKPPTREQVLARVEYERAGTEEQLKKGDLLLFFTKGPRMAMGPTKAKAILPEVLAAVKSGLPYEGKVKKLQAVGLWPPGEDHHMRMLIDKHQPNAQLENRIAQLKSAAASRPAASQPATTAPALVDPKTGLPVK